MRLRTIVAVAILLLATTTSWAQLSNYSQDFEGLLESSADQPDQLALQNDGWLGFVNVFSAGGVFIYNYGPFPAPNGGFGGPAISAVVAGEGGAPQGAQQLSVFSDYNNIDHLACTGNADPVDSDPNDPDCRIMETNVFQEQTVGVGDGGSTCTFAWEHKGGAIEGNSTALAFIKVLDPNTGFGLSAFPSVDTTSLGPDWSGDSIVLPIDPSWEPGGTGPLGHILQFGWLNTATNYEGSSNFQDNVSFTCEPATTVPATSNTGLIAFFVLLATAMAFVVVRATTRRATV